MDAQTFLGAAVGLNPRIPTFGLLFRGGQIAGTPLSYQLTRDCDVIRVMFGCGTALVSTQRIVVGALSNSTFHPRPDIICVNGATQTQWVGRRSLKSGDYVWIDSIGGLGANEFIHIEFEPTISA